MMFLKIPSSEQIKPDNINDMNKNNVTISQRANSLDVPALYPDLQWKTIAENSDSEGLKNVSLYYNENVEFYLFSNGSFWQAVTPQNSINPLAVESYYDKVLREKGWIFGGDGEEGALQFDTFALRTIIADGICGGEMGYIGYKDGLVRLISIRREFEPCEGMGEQPTQKNKTIINTIFISDPISVEMIENYIETQKREEK